MIELDLRQVVVSMIGFEAPLSTAPTRTNVCIGSTPIRRQHILDLRAALTAAYVAAGQDAPSFVEAIAATVTPIRASHIEEIRALYIALIRLL